MLEHPVVATLRSKPERRHDAELVRREPIRLDGDLYESTWDAVTVLYPKLSPGGFLIVDDYGAHPSCALAIEDYRAEHGITEPVEQIDWTGVFWRKPF